MPNEDDGIPDEAERTFTDRERQEIAELLRLAGVNIDTLEEGNHLVSDARALLVSINAHLAQMATSAEVDKKVEASREESARRRRLTVIRMTVAVLYIVLAQFWMQASYTESCSPGARTARVIDQLIDDIDAGHVTAASIRTSALRPQPGFCDVLHPFKSHSPRVPWPTDANKVGLVLIGVVTGIAAWVVRPRWWEKDHRLVKHLLNEGDADGGVRTAPDTRSTGVEVRGLLEGRGGEGLANSPGPVDRVGRGRRGRVPDGGDGVG